MRRDIYRDGSVREWGQNKLLVIFLNGECFLRQEYRNGNDYIFVARINSPLLIS